MYQAITWTNAAILSIIPQGTYFSEILFEIRKFSFKKTYLKMLSAKWYLLCLGLNMLMNLCNSLLIHSAQDCFTGNGAIMFIDWIIQKIDSEAIPDEYDYRKISNIRRNKSLNIIFLVSFCSCLCPIQLSQVLSREWRCSCSSADRRCSNYIWVIDNFIAH